MLTASPTYYRDKALRSLGELPPFSPILNKLLATLADEDASFARLAELIEKDSVLAGNVLRLVNSAIYGRRGTISSVRHAVSLIGVVKLRNAAMTLSVSKMWTQARTPSRWSAMRFNLHSTGAAIMSDLLAQRVPVNYPEGAFAGGLLHDIGLLLIAVSLRDQFEEIERRFLAGAKRLEDCEAEVIGFDHAELSAAVLAAWNLPEPIQQAVRYHHDQQRASGGMFPLSRILMSGEKLVNLMGITILEGSYRSEETAEAILRGLGLDGRMEELTAEFEAEFEPIRSFF
ncbi:MAG: HDOD domain-containing protein [Bryobacteraceae bacterium]|nr:HDOD domain-containing protein [Bryobacteraceae bacterium]